MNRKHLGSSFIIGLMFFGSFATQNNVLATSQRDFDSFSQQFSNPISRTSIPDPSHISYPPMTISWNTPAQRREHSEYNAQQNGLRAFMNHNSSRLEAMGDNAPLTIIPGSLDAAHKAYEGSKKY